MKFNKKLSKLSIIFILCILFLKSPFYYVLRSYIVMKPYSTLHEKQGILYKKNTKLTIPGGYKTREKDWFPYMMIFNADEGFSRYCGKDLSLTILYNFGHFNIMKGSSVYFDPNSSYFSSFYGAYVVHNNSNPSDRYGFKDDGSIDIQELNLIPKFDQTKLVLPSIGCPYDLRTFETFINNITENIEYMNIDGWTRIDSTIITNSPIHKYANNQKGYIQFGKPNSNYNGEDYPLINLLGRIYVKYIDEYEITLVMYIMAPTQDIVNNCDDKILSESKLTYIR